MIFMETIYGSPQRNLRQ